MEDLDFKEELKDIESAKNSLKSSLITFIVFLTLGITLHLFALQLQTYFPACFCYAVSSLCFLLIVYFKIKWLELMNNLTHKRLDELVDKYEELLKDKEL
jgi:hypothetical protein